MLAVINEDYPKVRTVIDKNAIQGLFQYILAILNIKANSKEEQDNLDFQMPIILDFIKTKFGSLTVPEIKEAFKMYVAKDFGHKDIFRTLDTIVVSDVLNCFVGYRGDALRTYSQKVQLLKNKPNEMTEQEKKDLMTDAIINKFERYKETKEIDEPFCHILEELIERGLIKITNNPKNREYYAEKYDIARKELSVEYAKMKSVDKKERLMFKEEVVKILNSDSPKIKVRQFRLVLTDFFNKQIQLGIDIKTIL